jgi:hypothetical protein
MSEKDFTLRDGRWVQRTYAYPTPAQQQVLLSRDLAKAPTDKEKAVLEEIRAAQFISASSADQAILQPIFEEKFPAGAELIDVDITLPNVRGIINCRVGGEHQQIRF